MKKTMKITVLTAILVALVALPFVSGVITPSSAQTQEKTKAAKINYAPIPAGTFSLDPAHSLIGFAVRHLEINLVSGRFKDFTGAINYDERDVTKSTVAFNAKISSIDTEVAARDKHLLSADFFDAEKYPEMSFKSTKVEKKGKDKYVAYGDFTLKGVTKQIELPFTLTGAIKDPWGNTRFGIEAQTKINRRDYGINYGNALPAGGFDVANEVTIELRLEAVKPEPKSATTTGK